MSDVKDDFEKNEKLIKDLLKRSSTKQSKPEELLEEFYKLIAEHPFIITNKDLLPTTLTTYGSIIAQLNDNDIQQSLEIMLMAYEMHILDRLSMIMQIIGNHPKTTKWLFDKIYKKLINTQRQNTSSIDTLINILCSKDIWNNQSNDLDYFLDKLFTLPEYLLNDICNHMHRLYISAHVMRNKIFEFIIKRDKTPKQLCILYTNLVQIIKIDQSIADTCIDLLEKHLRSPLLDDKIASHMIQLIGCLIELPKYTKCSKKILQQITKNKSVMNIANSRAVARQLGNTDILRSSVTYGKRMPKSPTTPYKWQDIEHIPINEPCILVFGGDGVKEPKDANDYMSTLESLFKRNGIQNIAIYGIVQNFGDKEKDKEFAFNPYTARKYLMYQKWHRTNNKVSQPNSIDDIHPQYIQQIFETIFLPRISKNGKKLHISVASRNIRNITIYAHCHGAYTFLKLEELMQQKMVELGYTKTECAIIQKQLLCIAFAPYCPLGISKSTLISFASTQDYDLNYHNKLDIFFRRIVKQNNIGFSYLPEKLGNLFIAPQIYNEIAIDEEDSKDNPEHTSLLCVVDNDTLTAEGRILMAFERNAIINAVKSSIAHTQIPDIKELVTSGNPELEQEFDKAVTNGNIAYQQVLQSIKNARGCKNEKN